MPLRVVRGALLLIASILLSGCAPDAAPIAEAPRLVTVERAAVDDAVERTEILGDLHGEHEVRVVAQLPERILRLHVEEGARVRAGDPIATLEADMQATGLQQASAALGAAEAGREQLRAEAARVRALVAGGALPRSQLESLEAQLRTTDAQVDQSRAARRSAGEQSSRSVVRAPIDGTIALLTAQEGDALSPGVPLCTVVQAERLILRLRATEQDYVRLREGMAVEVRPPALPDLVRAGVIRRISPVLDRVTRTAQVEVALDNADGVLRPGMVAEAHIELSRRPGVVLAPGRGLVLSSRTRTAREAALFVFDREAGLARRREVSLGARYGTRVEITDGLEGGEEVIVDGQHLLRDGAPIRVVSAPAPVAARTADGARPPRAP